MFNTYVSKVGKLEAPFELKLGTEALLTYEYFNDKILAKNTTLPAIFKNTILLLDKLNHHKTEHTFYDFPYDVNKNDFCMNVLMAFSGSLDSIYQTIHLKNFGYDVTLFYLNYNTALDYKRLDIIKNLANTLNLPLVICNVTLNNKLFVENSFNNLFMYALMLDCCQANNIYYISSGDSLVNISPKKTISSLKQVTETFFNELYLKFNFDFIPAVKVNKIDKLLKLNSLNLDEYFTDCINTDKFLKIKRNKLLTRLNIDLPENNCGVCPKCVFYNLLKYYYLNENLPQNYIDFCWNKVVTENTYDLFNKNLPLALRIDNLSKC